MKKLAASVAAIALFVSVGISGASAATKMSDQQLDKVVAAGAFAISGGSASAYFGFAATHSSATAVDTPYVDYAHASTTSVAYGVGPHASSFAVAGAN